MQSSSPFPDAIGWVDRAMMQRCLELARRALGRTTPNPLVGSIVARNGEIVGEGFHPAAGQPHAEIFALQAAGENARGATVYVNLEPCNHHGRTPPCTEALIAAGVAKVVVGAIDSNPLVAGTGVDRLRAAGIEVIVGVEEAACRQLNEAFFHRIRYQQPFGILKYAMTLDGKIAASSGHSAWVTGEKARHLVHWERAAADAVIIGGNTARQDNPLLTSHNVHPHNPLRVVMSRSLNLRLEAKLWHTAEVATLVLTETGANATVRGKLEQLGVEVVELSPLTPAAAMAHLYDRGLSRILWECGGVLAAEAIAQSAVHKIMAFVAPKIIGGRDAPSPIGELGLTQMTQALQLERVTVTGIEPDFLIEGYLPLENRANDSIS
ncbi:bifunctional diaminohydroxyphosphoribosylaminopyrimidine deaminase/5-amino-6-(5-phosphoribosylamino)uracil reductase RibD [Oscillatoria sp. FACHB-1406]|uniref:bifunctional diaminohydroxyphosphoribosylaminopyrimidine deaminase/5-amino-6-(5-phosphoribosylamino)uracil reductase RibD n=1 Tax=Oscillatoria sp. FACHB-1406 TaxID=2692846 RepID=UPI0016834B9F|nr:bifunctional diaminohydroxyphosphoribosylaminopyrimidine deaminase/5-amino-6-(5-phosphoribosylamino)uracil reductase RibD [Oscillatoria sp. FACHB-1406]MBD2578241.1 bifunctional diaminohydroxyphosphoribosylaminopyrimidine deaminase/5-amino-6-(5-phosphoribosylamino)uracil reductase RibD [Oscillatoria sp. FACHB-1406]